MPRADRAGRQRGRAGPRRGEGQAAGGGAGATRRVLLHGRDQGGDHQKGGGRVQGQVRRHPRRGGVRRCGCGDHDAGQGRQAARLWRLGLCHQGQPLRRLQPGQVRGLARKCLNKWSGCSALFTPARSADVAPVADLACPDRWPTTRPTPTGCAASSSTAPRWPRSRARRARWRTARARAPWRQ